MDKSIFYYDLPKELIAQTPLETRCGSRLLVLNKESGEIRHMAFKDIINLLNKNDCLVLNDTKVIPARLMGVKKTGGAVEVLLLEKTGQNIWEALVRPGRRVKEGERIYFGGGLLTAKVKEALPEGVRLLEMECQGVFEEILGLLGETPLPPYITKELGDKGRYQTVYAEKPGSSAAPTAGLHFTPALLGNIRDKGVKIAKITLHVGLGTFRPIKTNNILEHKMHSEFYSINKESAGIINGVKEDCGRVICVGTTSLRAIETAANSDGFIKAGEGHTDIFIYPGYKFKITQGLVTNFHLPESTLIALVSALAGTGHVMAAYKKAVEEKYRFFSFGDAMVIL